MDKNKIKIIFMGTPKIAEVILEGLLNAEYNIVLTVTNVDKIVGRKKELTPSPVKVCAVKHNIEVFQPVSIKTDYQRIIDAHADILITCAYGQIVPEIVLNSFSIGCLNVHGSLLPHLRGASPIQSALFCGLKETGVTIMEMVKKMDAGKMYYKQVVPILEEDNYTSLYAKIAQNGIKALLTMLPAYIEGTIKGEEQNETEVTFCKKILPEDERLTMDLPIKYFINKVRGLSMNPGGYVIYKEKKLKILKCAFYSLDVKYDIGSFVKLDKNTLLLQLNTGLVKLEIVQKENKSVMDIKSFMNGERDILLNKVS